MTEKGGVTHGVVRYMLDRIECGAWKVGEKIDSENTLTQALGVSRVSVRKAISQFAALGIMRSVHGKGTYLISGDLSAFTSPQAEDNAPSSVRELREVLDFRMLVEPQLCARATLAADAGLIERLEGLLEAMRQSVGSNRAFVEADQQFHLEICRACGNGIASEIMGNLFRKRAEPHYMLSLANGFYGGIYYHDLILAAMKKGDDKRARSLMQEHLRHGLEALPEVVGEEKDEENE